MDSPDLYPASSPIRPHTHPFNMRNTSGMSQLDEGYSEETRSQPDSDMTYPGEEAASMDAQVEVVIRAALALPAGKKKDLAMALIRALSNGDKEEIQKHIETLTHFDPVRYLPVETWLQVLEFLSPKDLLTTATVSRSWRERAFDESLWRKCFAQEGWVVDKDGTEAFEKAAQKFGKERGESILTGHGLTSSTFVPSLERRESRKRSRNEAFSDRDSSSGSGGAMKLDGTVDVEDVVAVAGPEKEAEGMEGLETTSMAATSEIQQPPSSHPMEEAINLGESLNQDHDPEYTYDTKTHNQIPFPRAPADFRIRPTIFHVNRNNSTLKLSWPYLYKQRRRLEANWDKGQFKMFQLPHSDYPEEGHSECVYTIQHTARHLVSGSRDKSIRIWNLQTNRLKCDPLEGHEASVLCLQFDERPEQDIIVSGGSDSSVIIWKFSTGEMIKHLREAHEESVLNLRFDDRYIVTCSKDKTIKIWNRQALARDSELIPTAVIDDFADPARAKRGGNGLLIEPFTHLSTIRGHGAAVNAVMIHDNTIVSASGDRTVKAWDIISGKSVKNYSGHSKGIACVQYDGRRVVSGSSDNTVRIFDADVGAEVATLAGHTNLVRTVQARFGDMNTTTSQELARQAARADARFHRAVAEGLDPSQTRRNQMRAAGSDHPEDMISVGASIPPGGGGTRWAKIVSGSYDETVIIWKRDPADRNNWVAKHTLNQNVLLREMRRRQGSQPQALAPVQGSPLGHIAGLQQVAAAQQQPSSFWGVQQPVNGTTQAVTTTTTQQGPATTAQGGQGLVHTTTVRQTQTQTHTHTHAHNHQPISAVAAAVQNGQQQAQIQAQRQQQLQQLQQAQQQQQQQLLQQQANIPAAPAHPPRESYRIFKLQFDARRIICCSQNKVIVGWDFANGDRELERVGDWSLETA